MEIRQISTFATAARLGSFVQAAQSLGYAQSTISTQIQLLESELGVRLFERLGHRINLTDYGVRLLPAAERLLSAAEEIRDLARDPDTPRGGLVVGTGESLSAYRLPPLFRSYRQEFPQVEMTVRFANCRTLREQIRMGEVDVGVFLEHPIHDSDLLVKSLCNVEVLFLAVPGHKLLQKAGTGPADFAGECLLMTEPGCSFRMTVESLLAGAGVQPRSRLEAGSIETIKQFAKLGLGLAMLPRFTVEREIEAGELLPLEWSGPKPEYQVQIVTHKDKWQSPALKAFLDLADKELA